MNTLATAPPDRGRRPGGAAPGAPRPVENAAALETSRNRLVVAGILFAAGFLAVAARLVDVAFIGPAQQPHLAGGAGTTPARRADITDRNGVLLATSLATASLYANPRKLMDVEEAVEKISGALPDLDRGELRAKLTADTSFVWIRRNLTPRQQYRVHRLGLPGLDFRREARRVYPHGSLAAHVVGFTGIDGEGLAGVERSQDARLRRGRESLGLAIDSRVQQILRQELAAQMAHFDALGAGGVVLDARNGEVLALVSLPDFDPNLAGQASEDARFNRVTLGVYELGSVFKIFNHAVALETGTASLADSYDATRPIRIARFTITDFHGEARWLTLPEIFMYSSNIGAAKMALDVGAEAQRHFLSKLGLLRRSAIELPEAAAPLYPSPWRAINTMTIAYGHGIAVSPLHLASAVSAVVNGGVMHPPTLLTRRPGDPVPGTRVISARVSDQMRRLMRLVVEHGTGKNGDAPGYLVGGKTGTAEKLMDGRYQRDALVSSFVAAFPITRPRYVIVVMLDEPKGIEESFGFATGGWTAAPVVAHVVARMAPLMGVAPVDEDAPEVRRRLAVRINARDPRVANF